MLRKQWNSYVIARQRVIARPLMIISYYPSHDWLLFILESEAGSQQGGGWKWWSGTGGDITDWMRAKHKQSAEIFFVRGQTDRFKNTHFLADKLNRERWKYCPSRITLFIHARNLSSNLSGNSLDYTVPRPEPFWICVVSEKPICESEFNWWVTALTDHWIFFQWKQIFKLQCDLVEPSLLTNVEQISHIERWVTANSRNIFVWLNYYLEMSNIFLLLKLFFIENKLQQVIDLKRNLKFWNNFKIIIAIICYNIL